MKSWRLALNQKTHMNMHFFIHKDKGSHPIFHPSSVEFVASPARGTHDPNTTPFSYLTDALTGLAGAKLILHCEDKFVNSSAQPGVFTAWHQLEALVEIYRRSHSRIKYFSNPSAHLKTHLTKMNDSFKEILNSCIKDNKINIKGFDHLIDSISHFENKIETPLIYNFGFDLSWEHTELYFTLYSFLFNLRALIALDYNSHIKDATFEALRVDSVSDYINEASYTANDAIMFHAFSELNKKHKLPESYIKEMTEQFQTWTHNGSVLYRSLPPSLFKTKDPELLVESLYSAQMDWLLGTPAGVLFRLREELYAYKEGFDKLFWPEVSPLVTSTKHNKLEVACDLGPSEVSGFKAVA